MLTSHTEHKSIEILLKLILKLTFHYSKTHVDENNRRYVYRVVKASTIFTLKHPVLNCPLFELLTIILQSWKSDLCIFGIF